MPMDVKQVAELKSLLAVAKKRDVNFGLSLGAKPEETVLIMHRIATGKKLATKAQEANEGSKLAFGIARLEGRILHLNCEKNPPAGMGASVKKFLATNKLSFGVMVRKGTEILEKDAEDEDTGKGQSQGNTAEAGKWLKAKAALEPLLNGSMSRLPDASALRASWDFALSAAEDDDFGGAIKAAEKLQTSFATSLKTHGEAQLTAALKSFDEVKSSFTDEQRKSMRALAGKIQKGIGKLSAVDIETLCRGFKAELAREIKTARTDAQSEKDRTRQDIVKVEQQLTTLEKSAKTISDAIEQTNKEIKEIYDLLNGPKRPAKKVAETKQARLELLRENVKKLVDNLAEKQKEIAPKVKELTSQKGEMAEQAARRFQKIAAQMEGLKQSVPEKLFKTEHAALQQTIKEMSDANIWREGEKGKGGELRRGEQDGSHGSSRHGAQTGIERQARRAATGGVTPDSKTPDAASKPSRRAGVTAHITTWKGANIEWEEVGGKRKIKSRTAVQKQIVAEVANIGVTATASVFATPVLEKLAVDTAIAKVNSKGWNEIYSKSRDWHDFDEVAVVLGKPKGKAGWGYAVTRKEVATMALTEANKVLKEFEQNHKMTEKEMLQKLGVDYLLKDGVVQMIPNAKVILKRDSGTAAWKSFTHYPHPVDGGGEALASWDIQGRRVRKSGGAEVRATY